jgi:hypothetical protein
VPWSVAVSFVGRGAVARRERGQSWHAPRVLLPQGRVALQAPASALAAVTCGQLRALALRVATRPLAASSAPAAVACDTPEATGGGRDTRSWAHDEGRGLAARARCLTRPRLVQLLYESVPAGAQPVLLYSGVTSTALCVRLDVTSREGGHGGAGPSWDATVGADPVQAEASTTWLPNLRAALAESSWEALAGEGRGEEAQPAAAAAAPGGTAWEDGSAAGSSADFAGASRALAASDGADEGAGAADAAPLGVLGLQLGR